MLDSDYLNGLKLAASIMNFGGKMQRQGSNSRIFVDLDPRDAGSNDALPAALETGRWDLPLSFKFGLALPVVQTRNLRIELLSDARQTNDNSLNADLGSYLQYTMGSLQLDLRAGDKDLALGDAVASHVSYGAGLSTTRAGLRFGVDYAYVPFEYFNAVQMLDLRLSF